MAPFRSGEWCPPWAPLLLIVCAVVLSAPGNSAGEPGANSAAIIDRAVAAHGGDRLANLATLVTEWALEDARVRESRRPAPPWDVGDGWQAFAIDFDSRRYADARYDAGGGYEWITGTVLGESGAHRLDYRNRSYQSTTIEFSAAIEDAMHLSPLVLLRYLTQNRALAEYAGQRRERGRDLQVLQVRRADGSEFDVLFETASGRVHGVESGYADYDGSHVPIHFRYADWHDADGLEYPTRVTVRAHGYVTSSASLVHIRADGPISSLLEIPERFRETENEAENVRAFRLEEIADGLYFVGEGVMYQLIVEFDGFLVALDASSGDVARRIDAVQRRIPDKPFRYVLASHHHNDHLHGLDDFAMLGATVLASTAHVATVTQYIEERLGRAPDVVAIADEFTVSDGERELNILDIGPTPHSEHILAAHLPAEKIMFTADLFVLGGRRSAVKPAMANAVALFEVIRGRNLEVERIVDPHSPLIARMDDLERAVDALHAVPVRISSRARSDLTEWRTAGDYVRQTRDAVPD